MLRGDLEVAGIPYRAANGQVSDFHALRGSYISLIVRGGANPKVAQTLARHSDPKLTFNVYAKAHLSDVAGAVADLPISIPGRPSSTAEVFHATGTDGAKAILAKSATNNVPRLHGK